MKDELVSIVVPVYNVDAYLDDCLESIIKQTYNNIEIILINDGSTDTSSSRCEYWANKDSRIKYISKNNEGLGATRNLGLSIAQGKYIAFIDSDDWIDLHFIEVMHEAVSKSASDIAECDFWRLSMNTKSRQRHIVNQCMGREFSKSERIVDGHIAQWKMLFRTEFLKSNNINYPNIKGEDLAVYAFEVILAKNIASVNLPLYFYRKERPGAISFNKQVYLNGTIPMQYLLDECKKRKLFTQNANFLYQHLLIWASKYLSPCISKMSNDEYNQIVNSFHKMFNDNFHFHKKKTIFVFGSYNLTRIVQCTDVLENPYYRFQFSSIPTIMSKADKDLKFPKHHNPYREFMLARELHRDFLTLLEREKPNYICIDFIEERHDLLEYHGKLYTKSDALMESDFPVQDGRTIERSSEECRVLWENTCLTFIDELKKRFQPEHIILIENVLSEQHGNIYACKEFENSEDIKKINKVLRSYYSFFKEHFFGIQCIDMTKDDLYITDDQFEYGCYPWHLNGWMNKKIGEVIRF